MKNSFVVFLLFLFSFPFSGAAQDESIDAFTYEVNKVYQPLSIATTQLNEASTLAELNSYFKPEWVKEYISVEILTSHKGKIKKAITKNDILSKEQKEMMQMADVGSDISVKVQYIPDNTLKYNNAKEASFTFVVNPEKEAKYAEGEEQLKQYLKEKAIDQIPDGLFINYDLAAVKFTITEEGEVTNVHVLETSKDEKIDALFVETIQKMPCWKPAEYANGTKVNQEFVLTVGNMKSCVVNLLNIRKGLASAE